MHHDIHLTKCNGDFVLFVTLVKVQSGNTAARFISVVYHLQQWASVFCPICWSNAVYMLDQILPYVPSSLWSLHSTVVF